ncbi:MAG: M48 family metalloprotease [Planctomycetota bacterium]|jgi:predicted Zn-dependent protease
MRRAAILSLVVLLATCATDPERVDPVTNQTYRSPIGNDFNSQIRYVQENFLTETYLAQDGGELPEAEMYAACNAIFNRILSTLPPEHKRDFQFRLYLTASSQVNAYTYGAGRVHLHVGLVASCNDASELAGILAHEIGHNSHDHIGQQLGRSRKLNKIVTLGGILRGPGQHLTGLITMPFTSLSLASHSREEERQADDRAVEYTTLAGIDPDGIARYFQRMQGAGGLRLFDTHPSPDNRVEKIRAHIEAVKASGDLPRNSAQFARILKRARAVAPYYEELQRALGGEDVDPVITACNQGIDALPAHPMFRFWKGIALISKEKNDLALPYLRSAFQLDKTNVTIPFVHCVLELQFGRPELAESSATRAIGLLPSAPQPWLVRGAARVALKRKEEGHADFDSGLRRLQGGERNKARTRLVEIDPSYKPKA